MQRRNLGGSISKAVICGFLLLLFPAGICAGFPQEDTRLYRIGRIIIHRREVFDGRHANWFGLFINKFHILTREDVIRSQLLFKEGDIYDPDLLEETERNLRALGIVGDVAVVPDTVRHHRVNVSVYTHDRWTLGLKGTYKQEGGVRNLGFSLNDDNFMGRGQGVTLGYNYRSDRNNPHGAEIDFVEPNLLGARYSLRAQYVNSEDARIQSISLERPFFKEEATWAGGLYGDFGQERYRQFQNGTPVLQDYIARENQNAWFAVAGGADRWTRYRAGLSYLRTRLASEFVPPTYFDRLDLLNLSASVTHHVYYKGKFIENFGRVEDVPLGYNFGLIVGKNFHFARSSMADLYIRFDGEYALGWNGHRNYLNLHTTMFGFRGGSQFKDATVEQTLLSHWRATNRTTLVGRVQLVRGYNWSAGRQLILGSPTGLPGYGAFELTGQQQLLVNLEYRYFSPLSAWIFNFGGAVFAASGTAWNAGDPLSRQQMHSSVGFGFRIENSAQQGSGIIRIDFPFNFDERRFTEVVISSDQLFRAFSDISFIAPNVIQSATGMSP